MPRQPQPSAVKRWESGAKDEKPRSAVFQKIGWMSIDLCARPGSPMLLHARWRRWRRWALGRIQRRDDGSSSCDGEPPSPSSLGIGADQRRPRASGASRHSPPSAARARTIRRGAAKISVGPAWSRWPATPSVSVTPDAVASPLQARCGSPRPRRCQRRAGRPLTANSGVAGETDQHAQRRSSSSSGTAKRTHPSDGHCRSLSRGSTCSRRSRARRCSITQRRCTPG